METVVEAILTAHLMGYRERLMTWKLLSLVLVRRSLAELRSSSFFSSFLLQSYLQMLCRMCRSLYTSDRFLRVAQLGFVATVV